MKERAGTPFWIWPNILSLDAPLVALVWQDFLARCYPVPLRPPARWVLGMTVWAIYLADRLLDSRHPAAANESARHRFYRKNNSVASLLLALVLVADALTSFLALRPDVFRSGLLITAGVVIYLAIFAVWRKGVQRWKHPSAAILFTIGVFLVAWTRTANPAGSLSWPAVVFCVLCLGNLSLAERWEQSRTSPRIWIWMITLIAVCALLRDGRWYLAIAASALGVAVLDLGGEKLAADARHVLADAVLLTPLLFR